MPSLILGIRARAAERGASLFSRSADRARVSAVRASTRVGALNVGLTRAGGSGLRAAAALAAVAGALAAVAAARRAVTVIADFERTLANVRAVAVDSTQALGLQELQFQRLTDTARELGATTEATAVQAGEGLLFLARAGFSTTEAIESLPDVLNLAIGQGIELGEVADFTSNILRQFNLTAEETERVVDTLTNTANSSNTNVRQLADAFKFVGPLAAALGADVETVAGAVGVLGDAGIQASLAGTNLRGILAALIDPTNRAENALRSLSLTNEEVDPTLVGLSGAFRNLRDAGLDAETALQIFNRRQVAAGLILADSVDQLDALTDANRKARGEAQRIADLIGDTVTGAFRRATSAATDLALEIGETGLRQALSLTLNLLTTGLRETTSTIRDWREEFLNSTLVIEGETFRFGDVFVATLQTVGGRIQNFWNVLFTQEARDAFQDVRDFLKTFVNNFIASVNALSLLIEIPFERLATLAIAAQKLADSLVDIFNDPQAFAQAARDFQQTIADALDPKDIFNQFKREAGQLFNTDFIGSTFGDLKPLGEKAAIDFITGFGGEIQSRARTLAAQRRKEVEEIAVALAAEFAVTATQVANFGFVLDASSDANAERTERRVREAEAIAKGREELDGFFTSLQNEVRLAGLGADAREEAIALMELEAIARENNITLTERQIETTKGLVRELQRAERTRDVADSIGQSFGDAFESVIIGGQDLKESLSNLFDAIISELFNVLVTQQVVQQISNSLNQSQGFGNLVNSTQGTGVGASTPGGQNLGQLQPFVGAQGLAISAGSVVPAQTGAVLTGPTLMPLGSGQTVLAGEAGAEGILPLTRTANGDLGVRSSGGGGRIINQNIVVQTPDADSFRRNMNFVIRDARNGLRSVR